MVKGFNYRPSKKPKTEREKQLEEKRRKEADRNYDRCARVKTLPQNIHTTLRQLGHARHDFHAGGETLFFMTKEGRKMERDILHAVQLLTDNGDRFPELIPKEDLSIYFDIMKAAGNAYIDDHSKAKESMDTFVEAKEKVNELITDLMKAVDKVHHTTYAPHGHYRYNDSRSESMKELSWMVPDYEYQERKFLRNNGHSHKQGKSGKKPHQKTKRSRNHDDDLWFDL